MDENLAGIVKLAIVGGTITISMLGMAIAQVITARRRRNLPNSAMDRMEERLTRMEQAIDAIATEVERVSESQRFTSRLLVEGRPAGQEVAPETIMEQASRGERRR